MNDEVRELHRLISATVRDLLSAYRLWRGIAKPRDWTWAWQMRRAFALDVLRCSRCADRMELIATIDDPAVVARILEHLGLPGARAGPEPTASVSRPRDTQPALPFALPSGCRRPAGQGGRVP